MTFDLLITGGQVADGTGQPVFRADVGVSGDRIAAIGDLTGAEARQNLDAGGAIVAPGFIDVHNHAHNEAEGGVLKIPAADNLVRMGVTTLVAGNCGGSAWPLDTHLASVAQLPIRQNYATLVGHGTLRSQVVRGPNRTLTREELVQLQDLARQGMDAGAVGISTGYFARCVTLHELIEVSKAVAARGGLYASHIRNEGRGLLEAVDEALTIGQEAAIPVQISHIKTYGKTARPWVHQVLEKIHAAQARGVCAHADRYPYIACFTGITSLLGRDIPAAAGARGGIGHVRDADLLPQAREAVAATLAELDGPEQVMLAPLRPRPDMDGKRLSQVAAARGQDPVELAIDLAIEGNSSCIFFAMCEENLETFYRDPDIWVATDGHLRLLGKGISHPRNYGTFPRALARYAGERGCFSLETGVAKMTAWPARKFGLRDRGEVRAGAFADLTVLDWPGLRDRATFENGHQYPDGIRHVVVNGGLAVQNGTTAAGSFGRVLRKG